MLNQRKRRLTLILRGVPLAYFAVFAGACGVLAGLGGFTFFYGHGLSYFSRDPRACVNCHIMSPQYDSWQKSSHHTAATCVDCHLPHDFLGKYYAKARNGWNHSKAFTLQNFPEPIRISDWNLKVLENNCADCHQELFHGPLPRSTVPGEEFRCVHCHLSVGHGPLAGLGGPERPNETKEIKK